MLVIPVYIQPRFNPCYRMHYKGHTHYTWLSDKGCLPMPKSNKRWNDELINLNRITKE